MVFSLISRAPVEELSRKAAEFAENVEHYFCIGLQLRRTTNKRRWLSCVSKGSLRHLMISRKYFANRLLRPFSRPLLLGFVDRRRITKQVKVARYREQDRV